MCIDSVPAFDVYDVVLGCYCHFYNNGNQLYGSAVYLRQVKIYDIIS